ncbi:hypothetical protein IAU60_004247 [Kwoniella sp. DSM 27419]
MSMSDLAEPSSSASGSRRYDLSIPTSLLILPPTAAFIGLSIGIVRGGGRARLRFLAENAHRPPKTIQGWYFYTKTRNYRVFFGAAKTGARYALGLGGATAAYVLLDEGIGYAREQMFGPSGPAPSLTENSLPPAREFSYDEFAEEDLEDGRGRRVGWRKGGVKWEDGALAGGLMGLGVGSVYRLPRQLFIRSVLMGFILGGSTSALQIAQAHIGKLREAEQIANPSPPKSPSSVGAAASVEEVVPVPSPVTALAEEDQARRGERVDVDLIPLAEEEQGLWNKIKGFVGL